MLFCILFNFICAIIVASDTFENTGFVDYHQAIGIPSAARIWEIEKRIMESANDGINQRIIGGNPITHKRFPWLAGLLITITTTGPLSTCGGSLLNSRRVLTAAHCWHDSLNKALSIEVVLGSDYLHTGGVRLTTSTVVLHPSWLDRSTPKPAFDACMLILPESVNFTDGISPISLPWPDFPDTYKDYTSSAAGYGMINLHPTPVEPEVRYAVDLTVIGNDDCPQPLNEDPQKPSLLCTSGFGIVGVCGGDSGGPLSVRICNEHILIGVIIATQHRDCQFGQASYHGRVTSMMDFINDNLDPPDQKTTTKRPRMTEITTKPTITPRKRIELFIFRNDDNIDEILNPLSRRKPCLLCVG